MESTGGQQMGLMHNVIHAHMSNVKQSLYIIDETMCESKAFRNTVINFNIEEMLKSKIYG
jgi:hypothetical protein